MNAPERFAQWMTAHEHKDRRLGYVYHYHGRSDVHSKALCKFIVEDLQTNCPTLREQLDKHMVVWETNLRYTFPRTGKQKTLDLAVGPPAAGSVGVPVPLLQDIFVACEEKTVMTEHGKAQPRIFDELSSSHDRTCASRSSALYSGVTAHFS